MRVASVGQWSADEVLCDVTAAASSRPPFRSYERRGCGRWPSAITRTGRRRTATRRRARPRWRSLRVGVGS